MDRRQVLKAAGVTSTVSLAAGLGAASDEERGQGRGNGRAGDDRGRGQEQRACPQPNCIHPVLGYSGLTADEQLPQPLQPDHAVDLETRPPSGDRPLPEFVFEPTGLHVEPGDVVRFDLVAPDHTVTAYHPSLGRQRRVPEGVPAFSSPVLGQGTFWLYRFDQPGVYDVLCAPHEIFGMVGRIVVGDPPAEPNFGPAGAIEVDGEEVELRPPELTAELVYADPALKPATIAEQGQVSWDALQPESKRVLVEFPEPPAEGE
ncbi:cupredoxin domain-containing protein [Halopiger xanaduensis]|uniref:Blue (Type 1) copper domain protein n=1 Tax=Halopiger xanaduensis (strain DSM 18323 / JCM 14033 / SH-6) TaxID=797210 RepID=F8D913_HALXS|nr:plastocyanin/azurin family copper-binding protein [Halopiger xanaduensis]AEH37344.1 blue (type 1) copper domain protein [Halopiger xanaduensis SH-6]